jgi:integrase/recombinase XerD
MNIEKYVKLYSKDLQLKNYAESTIQNYCCQVEMFLRHFESVANKPSEINERQIKEWLLKTNTVNSRKHRLSALKLFYSLTGKQPMKLKYIEYPRSEKKLPIVLSKDEIQRMFYVCENKKHKVILALLYSAGLRANELINLKWSHINRTRMIINVVGGKGNKDRQVMLAPELIPILIDYYREYKTKTYVLSGQFSDRYSKTSILQVVKQLAEKAKIKKKVWTHLIRHCFGTHLVESGVDIALIQDLLGHSSEKSTRIYLHISDQLISKIKSPITEIKI